MTLTVPLAGEPAPATPGGPAGRVQPPAVEIVVPVHNEEADLAASVHRLHAYLTTQFPFTFRVTVADNASTDRTWLVAQQLARDLPGVRAVRLEQKGRGRALQAVWTASDAPVLAYLDVDLSTDLNALLPLVAALLSGHSDLAIGSRLARSARVLRGPKRELISRCYNLLLHATLVTQFSDAQCGFKAIRADRARVLLPLVQDTGWFFDTELLVLAERAGLRIHEVPVDWVDDPDSRVDIVATAVGDLKGVLRLGRALATGTLPIPALRAELGAARQRHAYRPGLTGQVVRFAAIGIASTFSYVLLYLGLRLMVAVQPANAVALLATAVLNTAANRRFTFSVRGPTGVVRQHLQGLAVFGAVLALTSGALAVLHATAPEPARTVELAVLVVANLAATALRFLLLRGWVFGRQRDLGRPVPAPAAAPAGEAMSTVLPHFPVGPETLRSTR